MAASAANVVRSREGLRTEIGFRWMPPPRELRSHRAQHRREPYDIWNGHRDQFVEGCHIIKVLRTAVKVVSNYQLLSTYTFRQNIYVSITYAVSVDVLPTCYLPRHMLLTVAEVTNTKLTVNTLAGIATTRVHLTTSTQLQPTQPAMSAENTENARQGDPPDRSSRFAVSRLFTGKTQRRQTLRLRRSGNVVSNEIRLLSIDCDLQFS
jgi:hypothetical protein